MEMEKEEGDYIYTKLDSLCSVPQHLNGAMRFVLLSLYWTIMWQILIAKKGYLICSQPTKISTEII